MLSARQLNFLSFSLSTSQPLNLNLRFSSTPPQKKNNYKTTTNHHHQGDFPHYQQLFFCAGGINIEGRPVDACVESGKACDGGAAAAGFCRYLGFDGALPDQVAVSDPAGTGAASGTPARSVTGEWCTGAGYDAVLGALDREGFERLAAAYSQLKQSERRPCSVLERVACYRSRETLREGWKAAGDRARAVAVEQSLPGPSVAPRVGAGGAAAAAAAVPAAAATVPAAAAAAADSPAPAPRAGADVSVSSAVTSDAALAEDASNSSPSGGRRLLSA